jgi:hypothetical protein
MAPSTSVSAVGPNPALTSGTVVQPGGGFTPFRGGGHLQSAGAGATAAMHVPAIPALSKARTAIRHQTNFTITSQVISFDSFM